MEPRAIIIRTAGTNCDFETQKAFELAGAKAERVHVNKIISNEVKLSDYQLLAIPGGFSYGDDIASGKILANELKYKTGEIMQEFALSGKPIIGICNGFQVLVKMGLLPDTSSFLQGSTLTYNDSDKFECRWVDLRSDKIDSFWTKNLPEIISLPVAHGEGKFITKDKRMLEGLEANKQVIFRYKGIDNKKTAYPFNPNGAVNDIAGICNEKGNVLGMMPHPERYVYSWQHPSRQKVTDKTDFGWGLQIFKNAVNYLK